MLTSPTSIVVQQRALIPALHPVQRGLSSTASDAVATEIRRLQSALLDAQSGTPERFEPSIGDDGILLLDLGPEKGTYSFQELNGQLLLYSPLSGPKYYTYDADNRWWSAIDDGHLLDELLVRELMHITSVCLNL